ncbi:MAG: hypothetical protein WAK26_02480 [Terracidiphilus sp.]
MKIVYSTLECGAKAKAELHAEKLRLSFERKFLKQGIWHSIDLRACDAIADTEFSMLDILTYKQWRLEHLSLKQDPPGEFI